MSTRPRSKRKKKRRFLAPVVQAVTAPEVELDPRTGAVMGLGRKGATRVVWARKNKPEAEQRMQFYAPLSDARRIHAYVNAECKIDTRYSLSEFYRLAARFYLESKGK